MVCNRLLRHASPTSITEMPSFQKFHQCDFQLSLEKVTYSILHCLVRVFIEFSFVIETTMKARHTSSCVLAKKAAMTAIAHTTKKL